MSNRLSYLLVLLALTVTSSAFAAEKSPTQATGAKRLAADRYPYMVDLGTLGGKEASANGVSADGSVVVGAIEMPDNTRRAFRWTQAGGVQDLGTLGVKSASAHGVSADGTVVVGGIEMPDNTWRAFRWTQAGGVQDLGTLGVKSASAHGVSADGTVVVGGIEMPDNTQRAFRWTQAGGVQDLGTLGGWPAYVYGVSADGSVVVGANVLASGTHRAFRWTQAGGMEDHGTLGGKEASAHGVSADGTVVVGRIVMPDDTWRAYLAPVRNGRLVTVTKELAAQQRQAREKEEKLFRDAAATSAKLTSKQKEQSAALFKAAFELLQGREPEAAARQFEKGLAIDPGNAKARYFAGEAYRLSGNPGKAAVHYRYVITLDPKSKEAALAEQRTSGARGATP